MDIPIKVTCQNCDRAVRAEEAFRNENKMLQRVMGEKRRAEEALRQAEAEQVRTNRRVAAMVKLNAPIGAAWVRDVLAVLAAVPEDTNDKL